MSNSQNAAQGNDVPRDGAPPSQPPPNYTEQHASVAELPGGESNSSSHAPSHPQREAPPPPNRAGNIHEGSNHAGSYRPTDAQARSPYVHTS